MAFKWNGWFGVFAAMIGLTIIGAALLLDGGQARSQIIAPEAVADMAPAQAASPAPASPASAASPAPAASRAAPADERFVIRRILPITGPIRYGEWHWDDAGVPDGPIVITVDLDARVLSVFKGGYEIGTTAVLVGTQEKPTPLGMFPITQKDRHHVSNLYDAPMPYMQRLTNDGVTIHATNVQNGYASHGCIGTPEPFAARLFALTHLGDRVYITRGRQIGMGDALVQ
jgi:lipoprotein-anchoring transpeptidase ErfK/SrfK